MKITYEKDGILSLIYIYLREFDGNIVETIPYTKANMLFDKNMNWIGVEVFNTFTGDDELKLVLPVLKSPYVPSKNEIVMLTKDKYIIFFDSSLEVNTKMEVGCNVDHNESSGLQGIEFILDNFYANMEIADWFIKNNHINFRSTPDSRNKFMCVTG
jgi:hypothetical protein